MRAVVQRVTSARVSANGRLLGQIGRGLLVLVAVGGRDTEVDVHYMSRKIRELRIFDDGQGRMNRSVVDVGGSILVVSQFTLYGDCRKGRRPSFDAAAPPDRARRLYEDLLEALRGDGVAVEACEFQAMMQVELTNDGPVTLLLDCQRAF